MKYRNYQSRQDEPYGEDSDMLFDDAGDGEDYRPRNEDDSGYGYYDDIYASLLDEYEEIDALFGAEPSPVDTNTANHDPLNGLREALDERYAGYSEDALQETLDIMLAGMSPMEGFNFKKALSQISRTGQAVLKDPTVGQIAGTVLPVAGTAIGTIYGGPVGGALGAQLGTAAGQAFTGGQRRPVSATRPAQKTSSPKPPAPPSPIKGGANVAASQLLQLTQNPAVLQGLASLSLGDKGSQTVRTQNGQQVPIGAILNLISQLTNKAAVEADAHMPASEDLTDYLKDDLDRYLVDPHNPEQRAGLVYALLHMPTPEDDRPLPPLKPDKRWEKFFPFKKGSNLLIEYDTYINLNIGRGTVLDHTPSYLALSLHIPKKKIMGESIPETKATLNIRYKTEGTGNSVTAVVNGQTYNDNNVKMISKGSSRYIYMSITIMGLNVGRMTLTRKDSDEATLTFKVDNDEHTLILSN